MKARFHSWIEEDHLLVQLKQAGAPAAPPPARKGAPVVEARTGPIDITADESWTTRTGPVGSLEEEEEAAVDAKDEAVMKTAEAPQMDAEELHVTVGVAAAEAHDEDDIDEDDLEEVEVIVEVEEELPLPRVTNVEQRVTGLAEALLNRTGSRGVFIVADDGLPIASARGPGATHAVEAVVLRALQPIQEKFPNETDRSVAVELSQGRYLHVSLVGTPIGRLTVGLVAPSSISKQLGVAVRRAVERAFIDDVGTA